MVRNRSSKCYREYLFFSPNFDISSQFLIQNALNQCLPIGRQVSRGVSPGAERYSTGRPAENLRLYPLKPGQGNACVGKE